MNLLIFLQKYIFLQNTTFINQFNKQANLVGSPPFGGRPGDFGPSGVALHFHVSIYIEF